MDRKMYLCQNVQPASTLSAVWKGDQVSEKWRISSRFDTNIRDPAEWAGELILMTWQARTSEFLHKMSRLGWEEINKSASTLQPSVRSQEHPLELPSGPAVWNIICIWSGFDLDKIYQWRHSILSQCGSARDGDQSFQGRQRTHRATEQLQNIIMCSGSSQMLMFRGDC